jgi:hypothetical protein
MSIAVSELIDEKQKSMNEIESLKKEHSCHIRMLKSPLNQADVSSIDSFVSKRNMEEFSVPIMKRFRSNWFEKKKGRHVTYNTRQSVLRRKRSIARY